MTTKSQALVDWIDARFPLTSTWKAHLSETRLLIGEDKKA